MIAWGAGLPGMPAASASPGGLVPRLPGLAHHYRYPTVSGWPDRVGGVDGVHTGSPSLVADGPPRAPDGVEYNGSTQHTAIGDLTTLAWIHQTWVFAWATPFVWAGPSAGTQLDVIFGNTVTGGEKGGFLAVEDRAAGGGPLSLRALLCNGTSSTDLRSASGAITPGQLHHALVTCDGVTASLFLDGAEVDSAAVVATATGNSTRSYRIADANYTSPFRFAGQAYDLAIGNQDWSEFAAALAAEALA